MGARPASGSRSARLVAAAAVLVMASIGQCSLPEPRFPKLGAAPARQAATLAFAGMPVSAAAPARQAATHLAGTPVSAAARDRSAATRPAGTPVSAAAPARQAATLAFAGSAHR